MPKREIFIPPQIPDAEIITNELIERVKTTRGGWTREILAWLGVPWPVENGWKERIIGKPRTSLGANYLPLDATPRIKHLPVERKSKFRPFNLSHQETESDCKRVVYVDGVEDAEQAVYKAALVDERAYLSAEAQKLSGRKYWMVALHYPPTNDRSADYHVDVLALR